MKNRSGFVSNISSSSFIIAIKNNIETCPTCNRSTGISQLELSDLLNSDSDYDTELYDSQCSSKSFMESIGLYWDREDANRIVERIDNKLDSERIMYFAVGYSSEWLSDKIKKAENITIIYGENE